MNIIFLDLDGVITNRKTRFRTFDPDCINQLKRIIDATNAFIVISSSWRIGMELEQLSSFFIPFGLADRVIDKTPVLSDGFDFIRGTEIKKWLDNHEPCNIVILDDDSDMEPLMDKWVKTDIETGLIEQTADKAIQILNNT